MVTGSNMLRPDRIRLCGRFQTARTLYVVGNKSKRRNPSLENWARLDSDRKMKLQQQEYNRKLKELKSLTANVSKMITKKNEKEVEQSQTQSTEPSPESLTQLSHKSDSQRLDFLAKKSLFIPVVDIPASVSDRVGLAFKYLVSKTSQNWSMVLDQLEKNGGFKDIPSKDIRKFVYQIPKTHIPPIISRLEKMHQDAGVPVSPKLVNVFIDSLSLSPSIPSSVMSQIESYCNSIRSTSKKGRLPRETYELLVRAYGKNSNLEMVNSILTEMKQVGLQPSKNTFENILATSVYKSKDHKQAVEVFDTMKFLSNKTKPAERAYRDIIVSYVNNDDIEKALDLYNEMVENKVPVSQQIMVALARGCTLRPELKVKAWEFIFEIYNQKWEPTIQTLEYVLYLAAKDGDVALCRALVNKLSETSSVTVRSFSFLLLGYSKSSLYNEAPSIPPILAHENGIRFRRNILADSSYAPSSESSLPFLPVLDLVTEKEILAESSAMWAYANTIRPDFINIESANTYLNIGAKFGSLKEFLDRYNSATLLDRQGVPGTRVIEHENLEEVLVMDNASTTSVRSPLLDRNNTLKVPRDDVTYLIALKAASKARNYIFSQEVWSERGLYRKSDRYKAKSRAEKDKLDFQFAAAMVSALTEMNLLDDAMAILLSTEFQFKWTWKELGVFYRAAGKIGRDDICRTVRGVAGRAQINFGGKIRKRDYKRYVMERGY